MPTITVRNVSPKVVQSLKALAEYEAQLAAAEPTSADTAHADTAPTDTAQTV